MCDLGYVSALYSIRVTVVGQSTGETRLCACALSINCYKDAKIKFKEWRSSMGSKIQKGYLMKVCLATIPTS